MAISERVCAVGTGNFRRPLQLRAAIVFAALAATFAAFRNTELTGILVTPASSIHSHAAVSPGACAR